MELPEDKYNVEYFNSMSDSEMMQFKIDIHKKVNEKMQIRSKDPIFVSKMIIETSKIAEKLVPRYLKGYSSEIETSQKDIEECLDQMISNGDLDHLKKFMTPQNRLLYILAGRAILCASHNMQQAKQEVKQTIQDVAAPIIKQIGKNSVSGASALGAPVLSYPHTLCADL